MSTRGIVGFRIDGQDKLTYNHWDSYPSAVGVDILEECRIHYKDPKHFNIHKNVRKIKLVKEGTHPTEKQVNEYKKYADTGVSKKSLKDWYCLLRDTQGTIQPYIDGDVKHMIDSSAFILDSLFCEWGYIVNLDTDKLEVWRGFQHSPTKSNRYGQKEDRGYFPCKMIKEYDLNKLPTKQKFLKDLDQREEE